MATEPEAEHRPAVEEERERVALASYSMPDGHHPTGNPILART